MAGAAFGSCLKGWDVVACAARGARNRGRRSTLEMPLLKSWQAQHSVHLSVCLRGRGSIWQLSKRIGCCRARGAGRTKSRQAQHFGDAIAEVVAGAVFCAWQGQGQHFVYLGACLRGRAAFGNMHSSAAVSPAIFQRLVVARTQCRLASDAISCRVARGD